MKLYNVTVGGIVHTMQLDDEDAAKYGDAAVEVKQAAPAANKARSAPNKKA